MIERRFLIALAAVATAMFGALVWLFLRHLPIDSSGWASWVQAWGSIAAIVFGTSAVWLAHRLELERDRSTQAAQAALESRQRTRAQASLLLSLQSLASELRRMNVLAGYQLDAEENPILYPDIAEEFRAIAALLDRLPVDEVAALGKMDDFLTLRRTAIATALLYKDSPQPGDGFYRQNRVKLSELETRCTKYAIRLAEELKVFDPELYERNKDVITRL